MPEETLYGRTCIVPLFDEMSSSYHVSGFFSLGILGFLRRKTVSLLDIRPGMTVLDLMSGTGECWRPILRAIGVRGSLLGVDLSPRMVAAAAKRMRLYPDHNVSVECGSVTHYPFRANADALICAFGVKLLAPDELAKFAHQIRSALKPEGRFAILELRNPSSRMCKCMYYAYASILVPLVLRCLGFDSDGYRRLPNYLERYDEQLVARALEDAGLTAWRHRIACGMGVVYQGYRSVSLKPERATFPQYSPPCPSPHPSIKLFTRQGQF